MTNPIRADRPEPWRLRLTEGDLLEVRPAPAPGTEPQIVLTLPPWRAWDLSTTLSRYNQVAAIFAETSDIITEDSLARALHDARNAASGLPEGISPASRVGPAARGDAMVILQRARPELSHDKLVAVIDAAAWWLDSDEDYKASDLLQALTPNEAGSPGPSRRSSSRRDRRRPRRRSRSWKNDDRRATMSATTGRGWWR